MTSKRQTWREGAARGRTHGARRAGRQRHRAWSRADPAGETFTIVDIYIVIEHKGRGKPRRVRKRRVFESGGARAGRAEKEKGRPEAGPTAPVAARSGGGRGEGGRLEHELEGRAVAGEVVRHVCCARNELRTKRGRLASAQPEGAAVPAAAARAARGRGGAGARGRAPAVRRRPACAECLAKGNMVRAASSMPVGFSAARVSCVRPDAVTRSAHAGAFPSTGPPRIRTLACRAQARERGRK